MNLNIQHHDRVDEPTVTIIIPMYNVEKYIGQCIQSLLAQTYGSFEIICVNDGSDDETSRIVKEYSLQDERIILKEMEHCGLAGVARNIGMKDARGQYYLFLDGDDFFESRMLEATVKKIQEDDADVCLFGARMYYESNGEYKSYNSLKKEYIPEQIPFEGKSYPYIFNISSASPWNKLFRKTLIDKYQIEFMPLNRCNDVFFVFMAMALAERVTILNEEFVNYRQSENSLQATNDRSPWSWFEALKELKRKLIEHGIYEAVEQSFVNYAFGLCMYNLFSLKTPQTFKIFYEKIKNHEFDELEMFLEDESQYYSYNLTRYGQYQDLMKYDVMEFLFYQNMNLKFEKNQLKKKVRKAEQSVKDIKKSITFKTGKVVMYIPHKLKKLKK